MAFLLRVDPHVVAQCHVVGIGLVTIRAAEVARLVSILVVEQTTSVLVRASAKVAGEGSLLSFKGPQVAAVHVQARAAQRARGGRKLCTAVVGR